MRIGLPTRHESVVGDCMRAQETHVSCEICTLSRELLFRKAQTDLHNAMVGLSLAGNKATVNRKYANNDLRITN